MTPRILFVDKLESSGLFDEGNFNVGPALFGLPVLLLTIVTFLPLPGIDLISAPCLITVSYTHLTLPTSG